MELLVDRYRRVRSLGRGAMGEVWLADDTLLGRSVAIKQLRTDPDAGLGEWGDRMRREARLAAQLNHPNAVAVYDLIIDDEQPYVIMEYVPGDSLAQRIRSAGTLAAGEAGYWIGQVAAALEAAHANGILHRDVKPANILITPEGSAKLADFGVARSLRDATHTQTGIMVGTPAYLAPEVAQGGDPLSASDIWSLGATLYAAIEGRPPFGTGADNPLALLARIVSDQVPAAEHAGPLRPIIAAMLSRDPAGRPHAGEVRSWLTEETPTLGERTGPVGPAAEGDADRTQVRQRAPDPQPQPSYPPPGAPFPPQQFAPPMYAPGPGYSYGAPPPPPPQRRRKSGLLVGGVVAAVVIVAAAVVTAVAISSSKTNANGRQDTSTPPSPTTSSSHDFPSTSAVSSPSPTSRPSSTTPGSSPASHPKPLDVPDLPASGQSVPLNATPPVRPGDPAVRAYTSPDPTPTTSREIVEWQPPGLGPDGTAAIGAVTQFLTLVNQQDLQSAWEHSTERLHAAAPDQRFRTGFATSRHYQVAFGTPRKIDPDLIAIAARFVSRQDPAAQGNPSGVTGCTYWPQYVFLVARVNGTWLDDVAGDYVSRASVAPMKRFDTVRNQPELEPLSERVAC